MQIWKPEMYPRFFSLLRSSFIPCAIPHCEPSADCERCDARVDSTWSAANVLDVFFFYVGVTAVIMMIASSGRVSNSY